jgi:hypothetical protein
MVIWRCWVRRGARATRRNPGRLWFFRKTQNDWTVEAELKSTGAASSDFFGRSVAVAGDTILVGAFGDDETAPGAGAAYVFRNAGGWSQEAKLRADDGTASDFFGSAVALDGVRALIGARGESASMLAAGAAYVFAHDGAGWVQQQKLVAADAGTYDSFGVAVALHGAEVFIGPKAATAWARMQAPPTCFALTAMHGTNTRCCAKSRAAPTINMGFP